MRGRFAKRFVAAFAPLAVVASAAIALVGLHARAVPCREAVRAAQLEGDPMALPIVARPGPVRDLDGAIPGRYRFERDLGAVHMRYEIEPQDGRWGLGEAMLVDSCACDKGGLRVDVPTTSSGVVLRRAPGDVYVLTTAAPMAMASVPFRSVPAGSRRVWTGKAPVALASCALAALALAVVIARRARRQVERVATWHEGLVTTSHTVVPAEGGAALFTTADLRSGTRVLFSPPTLRAPYRDAHAHVEVRVGTRARLAAWHVARLRLAFGLAAVAIATSAAAMAVALTS
jgi:hypothetical protein